MNEYINIFIDDNYPSFIDKYLTTDTMNRLKYITQFCGCDYTKIYSPKFLFTRFDHSLVVAHMTWHFTHDKKETIVALLHDIGTPCFAHCIDYVFGDYIIQESSEKSIIDMLKKDKKILSYLSEDGLTLNDFNSFSNYKILENKSPRLCTDRLDGVLHTCYIWLHTHTLEQIKEVYNNMIVLKNEDNAPEIGFKDINIAEKFVHMVYNYATELQGNTSKYVTKFVAEIVKLAFEKNLITLDDLYTKKETDICNIFSANFSSWKIFNKAKSIIKTNKKPKNNFYIWVKTKKRNTIPLVFCCTNSQRINEISATAKATYQKLNEFKDSKYAYIKEINTL